MVRELGPGLKGVSSSWAWAKTWREFLSRFVEGVSFRGEGEARLNSERMAQAAAEYADAVVAEWAGKVREKLGELNNATVARMDGVGFVIRGERAGRAVTIEQSMIVNVSRLGRPYNQFPARIYVDGKFTSAAAYKKLFG